MIADGKTDLARVLAEPHRIAEIPGADIPDLLGHLEQLRATLWARMIREPAAPVRDLASDAGDEVLTVPEVARELRFTRAYVYEAVRRGDLHALRKGRYVRVRRAELRAWLEGRLPKGLDAGPGTGIVHDMMLCGSARGLGPARQQVYLRRYTPGRNLLHLRSGTPERRR